MYLSLVGKFIKSNSQLMQIDYSYYISKFRLIPSRKL